SKTGMFVIVSCKSNNFGTIWCLGVLVSGGRYPVFGVRYQVSGIRYAVSGFPACRFPPALPLMKRDRGFPSHSTLTLTLPPPVFCFRFYQSARNFSQIRDFL